MYLVTGLPGSGKTLLGMHFLEAGRRDGQTTLAIHGEESREELLANSQELGIDLAGTEFLDLAPESDVFGTGRTADLVDPGQLERDQLIEAIHDAVDEIDPDRVVVDPVTQLQHLEPTEYQYRKRIISFVRYLKDRDATVLTTATSTTAQENQELRSLSDGIVELSQGPSGRRIEVSKHRGQGQREGDHGMEIREGGIEVFPSLLPESAGEFTPEQLASGNRQLDELLDGGIERGTVTFITGPTGVGKTNLATQIVTGATERGERAAVYLFEENRGIFTHRSECLGMDIGKHCASGDLAVHEIEPLALSAEEFAIQVTDEVDRRDLDVVLIDGVDGYTMSLQGREEDLVGKLHALTRALSNRGVTALVTDELSTVTGLSTATSSNLSYVADNIVSLNYVEHDGELRRVIGVLKKRGGRFEPTLREYTLDDGVRIGDPIHGIDDVLRGRPAVDDRLTDD